MRPCPGRLLPVLLSLTLSACDGDGAPTPDDETDTTDSDAADTDDSDSPDDTEPAPVFVPGSAVLYVDFAYDPVNDVATSYTLDDTTLPPGILLAIGDAEWTGDFADTDSYCVATWLAAGAIPRDGAAPENPGVAFSMDVTANATLETDCDERIDPAWAPDVGGALAGFQLRYDLFIDLLPPWRNLLLDQGFTEAELAGYTNSGLRGTLATASDIPFLFQSLTSAYAIDTNAVVQVDGNGNPVGIAQADMFDGRDPAAAWYSAFFFLDPAGLARALGYVPDPPAPNP